MTQERGPVEKKETEQQLHSTFIPSLTMWLIDQQITPSPTVLKVWELAVPWCKHILVFSTSATLGIPNGKEGVGTGKQKSSLIFKPTKVIDIVTICKHIMVNKKMFLLSFILFFFFLFLGKCNSNRCESGFNFQTLLVTVLIKKAIRHC